MCGGGGGIASLIPIALDVAAVATGNPELVPLTQAVGQTAAGTLQGQGFGRSLTQGATTGAAALAGQELMPALGNAFSSIAPETASNLGITGGANSLTDLLGQTTGGGSLTGVGTIGGDLSSLFGGSNPEGAFTPAYNTAFQNAQTGSGLPTIGGTSSNVASTPLSVGSAAGGVGGGAAGGGVDFSGSVDNFGLPSASGAAIGTETNGNAAPFNPSLFAPAENSQIASDFGSGFAGNSPISSALSNTAPQLADSSLNNGFSVAQSPNLTGILNGTASSSGDNNMGILNSLFGAGSGQGSGGSGSNLLNGLLRSGLGGLLTNTNQGGYQGIQNAANQAQQAYEPFLNIGTQANNQLAALYGLNGNGAQAAAQANWQNTPGYQFALDQGLQAVNADAARKGQLLSGNNQRAVQQFGTGLAQQTYNNYLQNLLGQQQQGLSAAGGVGTAGLTGANAAANAGQARANNANNSYAGILSALFPQNGLNIGGIPITSNNANNGLLGLFGNA